MGFFRRGVFFVVSVLLLVSLLGVAFSLSSNLTLARPAKIKTLLTQSGFYDHFADNVIKQAQTSTSNSIGVGSIQFTNPLVLQAAHDALNTKFLEQQGSNVVDNNYAWLEGKSENPDFRVDLTPARQDFAKRVGQAVTIKLATLPACAAGQAPQTSDPLSLTCRPTGLNPQAEGDRLTTELTDNTTFLTNPIITPTSLNPSDSTQSKPYYQKFSNLPKVYQANLKAPYVFGALTAISLLALYLIASPKRKFVRRLAVVTLVAGVILVLNKLIADLVFNQLQKQAVGTSQLDPMMKSIIDFLHKVEAELVRIDLYFGIAFLVFALLLFVLLWRSRHAGSKRRDPASEPFTRPAAAPQAPAMGPTSLTGNQPARRNPTQPTVVDIAPPSPRPTTAPTLPPLKKQGTSPRKRPPRLIQ